MTVVEETADFSGRANRDRVSRGGRPFRPSSRDPRTAVDESAPLRVGDGLERQEVTANGVVGQPELCSEVVG
jgi:hypothetical protein